MGKPIAQRRAKKRASIRIQRDLYDDVMSKEAPKYTGGFNEITERLHVGNLITGGKLAMRYQRKYVRGASK